MAKIEKTFNGKRFSYLCNGEVYRQSVKDYKYACVATTRKAKGEISAVFYHVMPSMPRYKVGDKIGQICISETPRIVFRMVDELNETDRGVSGYGSTGLNVE